MASRWFSGGIALVVAAAAVSACAQTTIETDGLIWGPEAHPGVMVLPRLSGEGADAVNRLFDGLDASAEATRTDCLSAENGNAYYERFLWADFTGPRFLSIMVNETYYCGGAHPSMDIRHLTFDRRTGGLPDWAALWPGGGMTAVAEGYGNLPSVSRAPAIIAWFRAAVRADPASDAEWLAECDPWYSDGPVDEPVAVWLDAKRGGVGLDWASLPHAAMACGSPQIMPLEQAARLGASPELIEALREGHAARAFHDPTVK